MHIHTLKRCTERTSHHKTSNNHVSIFVLSSCSGASFFFFVIPTWTAAGIKLHVRHIEHNWWSTSTGNTVIHRNNLHRNMFRNLRVPAAIKPCNLLWICEVLVFQNKDVNVLTKSTKHSSSNTSCSSIGTMMSSLYSWFLAHVTWMGTASPILGT